MASNFNNGQNLESGNADYFSGVSPDMEVPDIDNQTGAGNNVHNSSNSSNPNPIQIIPNAAHNNHNQINSDNWHTERIKEVDFVLPQRYTNPRYIGHGAFGVVISAFDIVTQKRVAIKKLLRPFQGPIHAQRTYREVKFLMHLNHEDSMTVQLLNIFTPESTVTNFRSLYLVFNYIPYNLDQVIRRGIHFSEDHIQQIIYSILRGLKYIRSADIIHRDIKPVNIGIDQDSNVTIFDFGLARSISDGLATGYVSTRWWRAPEVFLTWERYNEKLDVWSVGCVMSELIRLNPIFQGRDYIDQLRRIMSVVGTPPRDQLVTLCSEYATNQLLEIGNFPRQNFRELFGYRRDPVTNEIVSGVGDQGINFIESLLAFDHRDRPTIEQALQHPFMARYHDLGLEPIATPIVDEHGNETHSIDEWRVLTWDLVQKFEPPQFSN